ncbi:MAG: aldo/keto reductase [Planctomycetota bacterium]
MVLSKRTFGQTGIEATQLGYGSMGLRGPATWGVRVVDDESAERFLNHVLDVGINFIDTAPVYGVTEERIGRALSGRRSEFFLATKCGFEYTQHADRLEMKHNWTRDVVARDLETSLKRMQTDYVDLMQFHGGNAETLQSAGLIDQLLEFKSQGLIRHIGVSSKIPDLEGLIALRVFETFQIPYSCLAPEHHDLISAAGATGAGIIIRGGIAHGGPEAEIERPVLNQVWESAKLDELLPDGNSKSQFILRFTLSHPHCDSVIVGTCNEQHMAENIRAVEQGPLPGELVLEIQNRVSEVLSQDAPS